MTVLMVGSTDAISAALTTEMAKAARERLTTTGPLQVTTDQILYHSEGIVLRLRPRKALLPLQAAAIDATIAATGAPPQSTEIGNQWIPHITIAYSTAEQPASPLIGELGHAVPRSDTTIDSLSLVAQWGPERDWDWQVVHTVPLAGPRPATP